MKSEALWRNPRF